MTTLSYLPPAAGFQDPDRSGADAPDQARAVIIPFGLEASVSYGAGTAHGPEAILAASQQLELFDEELWCEPYREFGIATVAPPPIKSSISDALDQLEGLVENVLAQDRFPLVLGGEHALTAGAIRPFTRRHSELVVLQIDAHADLRDGYQGEHFSHASAMRRVLDFAACRVVGVGIRAFSADEAAFITQNPARVQLFYAHEQAEWSWDALASALRGRTIYVTFDIDGLDSAVMPATGTPTPAGLSVPTALDVLRLAADVGTIVGADVVELAPLPALHACDYTAAFIANKILNYALYGAWRRSAPATLKA